MKNAANWPRPSAEKRKHVPAAADVQRNSTRHLRATRFDDKSKPDGRWTYDETPETKTDGIANEIRENHGCVRAPIRLCRT